VLFLQLKALLCHFVAMLVVERVEELLSLVVQDAQGQVFFNNLAVLEEAMRLKLFLIFVIVLLPETFEFLLLQRVEGPAFVVESALLATLNHLRVERSDLVLLHLLLLGLVESDQVHVVIELGLLFEHILRLSLIAFIDLFLHFLLSLEVRIPSVQLFVLPAFVQSLQVQLAFVLILHSLYGLDSPVDGVLPTSVHLALQLGEFLVDSIIPRVQSAPEEVFSVWFRLADHAPGLR